MNTQKEKPESSEPVSRKAVGLIAGFSLVFALAVVANLLSKLNSIVEYVLWAVALGLLVRNILPLPRSVTSAFKTELFIKTGLVLFGTTVNFNMLLAIGSRGLIQALLVIITVFLVSYTVAIRLGIDRKFAAVLSTAVSVCGVSAAIAAAGAVLADKKSLAYTVTLVVLFALPMLVVMPLAARFLKLPDAVAGAWIGGNIDTTPAVLAASESFSSSASTVAAIVKLSQNAMIGVVAFILATYYVVKVEKKVGEKPRIGEIWERFPKFILGFLVASILATLGVFSKAQVGVITNIYKWLFTLTFASIGLGVSVSDFKSMGIKPLLVFAVATIYNTALTFVTAWILFGGILPI